MHCSLSLQMVEVEFYDQSVEHLLRFLELSLKAWTNSSNVLNSRGVPSFLIEFANSEPLKALQLP